MTAGDSAKRAAAGEEGLEAIAGRALRSLGLVPGLRVLDVGCGEGVAARRMARESRVAVVGVDPQPALFPAAAGSGGADPARSVRFAPLAGEIAAAVEGSFAAALLEGSLCVAGRPLGTRAAEVHALLEPLGRIAALLLVRVGRRAPAAVDALGRAENVAALYPRELAEALENAGFEPLSIEVLEDALFEAHRAALERRAAVAPPGEARGLREQCALLRAPEVRACVALALAVARRREPGEVPPLARGDA